MDKHAMDFKIYEECASRRTREQLRSQTGPSILDKMKTHVNIGKKNQSMLYRNFADKKTLIVNQAKNQEKCFGRFLGRIHRNGQSWNKNSASQCNVMNGVQVLDIDGRLIFGSLAHTRST